MSYRHVRELAPVRDEYRAARLAITYVQDNWEQLHELHPSDVAFRHVRHAIQQLERTYLTRLFSDFEGILRRHLLDIQPVRVPRDVYAVIQRAARLRNISDAVRVGAHEVREYRNELVHRGTSVPRMTFEQAASRLFHFLAPLPD